MPMMPMSVCVCVGGVSTVSTVWLQGGASNVQLVTVSFWAVSGSRRSPLAYCLHYLTRLSMLEWAG